MVYVSLIVEVLRTRPSTVFWCAALLQALIWIAVPALFYAAPPGDLATVIAIGHEFQLGTTLGPPLAFWAAETAYDLFGLLGVYVLAQACVVVAFWAVFRLASAIVGPRQAGLAALLLVGISALTVPTPEFGPDIAAMPLWGLILLHYWFAVGEKRGQYWFGLAIESGLLLLTSTTGFILLGVVAVFTVATARGRAALRAADPWIAAIVGIVIMTPYFVWFVDSGDPADMLAHLTVAHEPVRDALAWVRLVGLLLAAHAGFAVLIVLASGWPVARGAPAAAIERAPLDPFARDFVLTMALAPALVTTLIAALTARPMSLNGFAPIVLLSGLAVIVVAGRRIGLHHQRVSVYAWLCLLAAPPAMTVAAILVLPWVQPVDLRVAQPADAMARFFSDSFVRRTGHPLEIVAGEAPTSTLVALRAPSRPSVLFQDVSSPWTRDADIRRKGAVVVWRATDALGTPPADIRARFPDLVVETRAFDRPVTGRLPLLRIGWGLIRPQVQSSAN